MAKGDPIFIKNVPWHTIPASEATTAKLALDPALTVELSPEQAQRVREIELEANPIPDAEGE